MKVYELSKQLGVSNKDLISYLKERGYQNVVSHVQVLNDSMIEDATKHFGENSTEHNIEITTSDASDSEEKCVEQAVSTKKFAPDDMIPCRSVTPWKLLALSVDKNNVYSWENFGDTEYVAFRDLQAMKRKDIIMKPKIIIEDPDLCSQWHREIGESYKPFIGVDYPEELFEKSDEEFERLLKTSSDVVREIIKVTALNMIKNENYPSVQKLNLIDDILGTCIKEFL